MNNLETVQIFALALGSTICGLTAIFSLLVNYRNKKRKRSLVVLEASTALLLLADIWARIFDGVNGPISDRMIYVSNFLVFFLVYVELLSIYAYIRTFIPLEDQKVSVETRANYIIAALGIAMLILSQYNGMFYSIDANNHYEREAFFVLSYVMPLLMFIISLTVTIKHRKVIPVRVYVSLMIFTILPLACAAVQGLTHGLSLFNLSVSLAVIIMFALSLVDQSETLAKVAATDRVTGLPNGYGFTLKIEEKIAANEHTDYSAIYFDVAHMGSINRRYGNQIGDYIIITYANMLREFLDEDEVIGRLGGNYFVALVRKDKRDSFLALLKGLDVPVHRGHVNEEIRVSSVAGVYDVQEDIVNADQIMTNISMAIAIAKNVMKKPYVLLNKELMQQMNERRQLQEAIPKYMAQKEFKAYYQPKVNTENNTLCGAEALTRWEHEGEIIPPNRYIPLMEQNDSICKFDFYMLNRVCEDLREWIDKGMNPPVISVNFSRKNLGNPNFVKEVHEVVSYYEVPPKLIQIEVTETLDEFSLETLKDVVEGLQKKGFTTAIDDFGTGSSSIKLFKEVPFDVLKIDKGFIDSVEEKDQRILSHIIEMAREMGANVITEGVEKKEQVEVLKKLGCMEIQGFFFDKPLPKFAFEKRMNNPVYE